VVDLRTDELEGFIDAMRPEGVLLCIGVEEGMEREVMRRVERW
jgi:hypothetical protein